MIRDNGLLFGPPCIPLRAIISGLTLLAHPVRTTALGTRTILYKSPPKGAILPQRSASVTNRPYVSARFRSLCSTRIWIRGVFVLASKERETTSVSCVAFTRSRLIHSQLWIDNYFHRSTDP